MQKKSTRRNFLKVSSAAGAGMALAPSLITAKSYSRILGANDRLNFAVLGLHGRGQALIGSIADCKNTLVSDICDVDSREFDRSTKLVVKRFGQKAKLHRDIRKMLQSKDIDVIAVATPEHWHAPMALMGLQAGKHVYLEKPCSHNPSEGVLLVKARDKYGKLVQMGNQHRSAAHTIKIIERIHGGLIGRAYFGKAWYANLRQGIGTGKQIPVPEYLDWDLWQGPAPRRPYKDNIHPYNWHWFWHWGTGEALNNGTHEVDVCRWALDAAYPDKITASGGRYHYRDDWEFYDTLLTSFEYGDRMITWEGLSCQGKYYYNRSRGAMIHGTEGSVLIDRNSYIVFDRNNKEVESFSKSEKDATIDLVGAGPMTSMHMQNLVDGIRDGAKLNSPIEEGNISVTMLQYTNLAWKLGRDMQVNPATGRIKGDKEATDQCSREYEPGWEPKI